METTVETFICNPPLEDEYECSPQIWIIIIEDYNATPKQL